MVTRNGGSGPETLIGSFDNDILNGNGGDDTLAPLNHVIGGASDKCNGGDGIDTLRVDASSSVASIVFGLFKVQSLTDDYHIDATSIERVEFRGSRGANSYDVRGALGGIVTGNIVGEGVDFLFADFSSSTANLTFSIPAYNNTVEGFLFYNMDGVEITTGSGNDRLTGGAENDALFGGSGNDYFGGSLGLDVINGGPGIDTADYRFSKGGLIVDLERDGGAFVGANSFVLFGIEIFFGGGGNDTLRGDEAANGLIGGAGNDNIFGEAGDDTLRGDNGDDDLRGGADDDRLEGGNNQDTLVGGAGKDELLGGAHNDIVQGGANSDFIDGGSGFDRASYTDFNGRVTVNLLTGKAVHSGGADELRNIESVFTGKGNDTLTGTSVRNILDGGDGNNTINGRGGNDLLWGGKHKDTILGGDNNDDIYGMDGQDIITGGLGRDRMFGNYTGDDGDRDVFVYNSVRESPRGSGRDIIEQFGKADVIDLRNIVAGPIDYRGALGYTVSGRAEVLVLTSGSITGVSVDINGDGRTELEIAIDALGLKSSNFLL